MSDSTYFKLDSGGQSISADHPLPVTSGVAMGTLLDIAWDPLTGDPESIMALLKGIAVQLAAINLNTAP
jgi:hypothetical protein